MIYIACGERLNEGVKGLFVKTNTVKVHPLEPGLFTRVRIQQIKKDNNRRAILNFNINNTLLSEKEVINKLVEEFAGKAEGTFSDAITIEKNWEEALEWLDSLVTMFSLSDGAANCSYHLV